MVAHVPSKSSRLAVAFGYDSWSLGQGQRGKVWGPGLFQSPSIRQKGCFWVAHADKAVEGIPFKGPSQSKGSGPESKPEAILASCAAGFHVG